MGEQVTFVTVGKLKGQTIRIGPDKKYQFVNGEMKVDQEIAGLVARSLQLYSAFPKGDAEPYHIAICEKLKIDPDTLQLLSSMRKKEEVVNESPDEEEEVEEKEEAKEEVEAAELPEKLQTLRSCLEQLDEDNPDHWTGSGKPALPAVKALFGDNVSRSEVDAVWKVILNDTD